MNTTMTCFFFIFTASKGKRKGRQRW